MQVDLNCDMGESYGAWTMGDDLALLPHVSSANIACGFHAGDPSTMARTVASARAHGVAIGAHPGLPDLAGFGRRRMQVTEAEAYAMVLYQTAALQGFAHALGGALHHVKAHGALYNMAAADTGLAGAIGRAVRDLDPSLVVYVLAGSPMADVLRDLGLAVAEEAFADRGYRADGSLVARGEPGALILDEATSVAQVRRLLREGHVRAVTGEDVPLRADTICVHGDQSGARAFAVALRAAIAADGIAVRAADGRSASHPGGAAR